MDSVLTCMVTDRLGPGSLSERVVREVSDYLGIEGGLAFREYPRAIKAACEALGLEPGARVVLSPLCPKVYHEVFLELKIEPVYVDVEPETGCISTEAIERLEGQDIGAILSYASLGFVPDLEALVEFGVPVIEDISQALGANTQEKKVGSYGNFVILSMEPENIITSGGGVLLLGRGKKEVGALRKTTGNAMQEIFLPDMNAALGLTQIKGIERFIERRKEIAAVFSRAVMQSRHKMLVQKNDSENVYYSFPVLLGSGTKDVQSYTRKKNIDTQPAFADSVMSLLEDRERDLPAAKSLFLRCLLFPLYPTLTKASISLIEKVLTTLP